MRLKKRLAGDGRRRCGLNPNGAKESLCRGSTHLHFGLKEELQYQSLKIADKVAATGYYVLVPDFLHDDPYDPKNLSRPTPVWLKDHEPGKDFVEAKPIIEALKRKGVSAVGVAGFCWGAKIVTNLGKAKLVQASVLLHPSYITVDDIRGVNVPIAILGAQHDSLSPPTLLKQFKQVLKAKPEIDSYVKVFPNVSHGWALRYDPNNPKAAKAAGKAHKIMIKWFDKHLKKVKNLVM